MDLLQQRQLADLDSALAHLIEIGMQKMPTLNLDKQTVLFKQLSKFSEQRLNIKYLFDGDYIPSFYREELMKDLLTDVNREELHAIITCGKNVFMSRNLDWSDLEILRNDIADLYDSEFFIN